MYLCHWRNQFLSLWANRNTKWTLSSTQSGRKTGHDGGPKKAIGRFDNIKQKHETYGRN